MEGQYKKVLKERVKNLEENVIAALAEIIYLDK